MALLHPKKYLQVFPEVVYERFRIVQCHLLALGGNPKGLSLANRTHEEIHSSIRDRKLSKKDGKKGKYWPSAQIKGLDPSTSTKWSLRNGGEALPKAELDGVEEVFKGRIRIAYK
jgi:hypothetical protein